MSTTETLHAERAERLTSLSLENSRLFVAAVALSLVPLWFGTYLPMVDLPGHAAVVATLQQLSAGNVGFGAVFETDWFTPYLLAYVLTYAISSVLPVTVTMQLVVSLSVAAVPLLTAALLRVAGADTRWRWLAIPGGYSFAFYWGFLPYLVAVPVALLLLIRTVQFERRTGLANALIVAGLALLLFFSHVIVMGIACLCALVYLAAGHYGNPRRLFVLCLPYTAPLPLIGAWLIPRLANEVGAADAPVVYGSFGQRLELLFAGPAGFEYLSWLALIITAVMAALPALAGSKLSRSPARWLPFGVVLLLFLATPSFAVQSGFLYERLGVFLLPLWLLMWDAQPSPRRRYGWIAMPIVILWIVSNTARFASFARETEHFDAVVAAMEPGKRVAAMIADPGTPLFATPVYLHFASWYQTQKLGIVDFNFADFRLVVRRKHASEPRIGEDLAWYPRRFDWSVHGGDSYDYFLVKANADVAPEIFKSRLGSVKLVTSSGWWWLYANVDNR